MAVNRMRGQLQVAGDIQQQGRAGGQIGAVPSNGIAEAAGSIAGDLSKLSSHIGRMADQARQDEGVRNAKRDALDPEFRTIGTGTIYARAYDQAGLQVAETRLETEIAAQIGEAAEKHRASPAKLSQALAGIESGFLASAPDELRPKLQLSIRKSGIVEMRQATRDHEKIVRAEQSAAMQSALDLQMKQAHQQAYAMGLDAEADGVSLANMGQLTGLLNRRGVDGRPLIAPAEAARLKSQIAETITDARLTGAFDRLPDTASKARFLDGLKKDFAGSQGLAKVYDLQGFEKIQGHLSGMLRASIAADRQRVAGVLETAKDLQSYAAKGFAPTPDQLAGLKARAAANASPELAERVAILDRISAVHASLKNARPEDMDGAADSVRDEIRRTGPNAVSVAVVEHLEGLATEARTMLKTDPLGWADRVGLVQAAPLDMSSQSAMLGSLKQRVVQAEYVAAAYGVTPHYLRPDEKRALAGVMANGGAGALEVATAVAGAVPERAAAIMGELGKHAPAVAHLGALVASTGGTPSTAAVEAADGVALLRTEGYKAIAPKIEDLRSTVAMASQGVFARLPEAEAAVAAATNAAYEVRARKRGVRDFDSALWTEVFQEMVGQRTVDGVAYGGIGDAKYGFGENPVIVPPDVKQDGFGTLVAEIKPADFGDGPPRYQANKQPVTAADLKRASLVQERGVGRYRLNLGSDAVPAWLVDADGNPFVLDFADLRGRLRQRRPDLYLGGK